MNKINNNFKFEFDKKIQQIEFKINSKIYPLTTIYQATYLFLDKVYVFLDGQPEKEIKAFFKLKEHVNKEQLENLVGQFYNELLNQVLREKISQANDKIREYIVSQALYSAVPSEVDELLKEVEDDWQKDPLGIAQPWQEKKQAAKKSKKSSKKVKSKK
ncbi:MAG: His-Xaa-Ser system protein HxsD [Candidatus Buchananbacteria bacterium]|nr:His-Xaa-Ser system protein HxsD [Candidatus Buchananbacteria bacterium]